MLGEHHKHSAGLANTAGLAVWSILLQPMDCGNSRFESLWAIGLSSLMLVVYCVCIGLYDVLIIFSGESYRVSAFMCGP